MKDCDVFQKLAELLNFPQSRYLPRILEKLITPEQGEMLLRLPSSSQDLAQQLQEDVNVVDQEMEDLVRKGLAIPRVREGATTFSCVRSALQFHDSSGVYEPAGDEVRELWRQWRETEVYELCRQWERLPVPIMRVFPYPQTVERPDELLPHEDLDAVIAGARQIAVVKCVCRLLLNRCERSQETCLTFDTAADYALRRGVGRRIDAQEARRVLQLSSEQGLVPSNLNSTRVTAMCFCCPDCCIFIQPQRQYGYRLLATSRYEARVDPELCSGCQDCVALCQFDAIEMVEAGSRKLKASVQADKCYGCGVCALNCPAQALTLRLVRPPQHIPEIGPRY